MSLYDLYEACVLVNLKDYHNIGIDLQISKIIIVIIIGLILLALIMNYKRACLNSIIKKLILNQCFDEESAKTLSELNISSFGTRFCLSHLPTLKRIINMVGQGEDSDRGKKADYKTVRIYIEKDRVEEAAALADKKYTSILNTILFCILILLIGVIIILIMPELLSGINYILE